jgi:hypothetical protein
MRRLCLAVGCYGAILESGSIVTLSLTPDPGTGLLSLSVQGPIALGYTVQMSTDLISWQTVTSIVSTQPINVIFDGPPATSDCVFYRAYSQ